MRPFLLILIAAFLMVGCKKDTPIAAKYYGRWELRKTFGGFGGGDSTYAAGNGNIYQFNNNSTYKHFREGVVDAQGSFKITQTKSTEGNYTESLYFDNDAYGTPISLADSKLTVGTSVADGITQEYAKIGN